MLQDPLIILVIGMLIVIGGIIFGKLNPFIALIVAALVVAWLTPSVAIVDFALSKGQSETAAQALANTSIGERIAAAFGSTVGKIGILIAMAAIIGKAMLMSGAAERIVRSILGLTGEKNAPLAFLSGSFFLGIPVFFDTVFYLMIPLAKAMAMRLKQSYLLLVLCITAGAAMANSLVPPTPGPLFLIAEMDIPIGMMMVGGFLVGSVTIIVGYFFAVWVNKRNPIPLRESLDAPLSEIEALANKDAAQLPSLGISLSPILVPLVLITGSATVHTFMDIDSTMNSNKLLLLLQFFGEKNMALIMGALAALLTLFIQKKKTNDGIKGAVQSALTSGGVIILITAAGGAFGAMLQQTGISLRIAELTSGYQMALIPLAFFITALVRTAQGSATVAMITASGILSGMSTTGLDFHHLYLGLAIACGSKLVPWMNDSGFWIVCKMSNLTEKEALRTFSPLLTIMGIVGLITIMIAAKIFPLV
ncbi:GntP family permease [Cyclobacterium marinum]|uniref:Gluconate transporter n=1 Tax=Cyclobacterium marinum (strain ATCC 25205 / DSM 745 / LMG 13164 / NCIMB 1802) TaxID=880070 RepID=G0J854_CYCMS|nr:gluconate transporter [Cyclobacterium marinum]AEL27834.1 Gluconate transporter [Cyclobacterium marinum DSM 745]|tara:strand:- start:10826 stop:12259 length:1434 start_codon:yes stop_codon:yes gene_type:complete